MAPSNQKIELVECSRVSELSKGKFRSYCADEAVGYCDLGQSHCGLLVETGDMS